MVQEYLILAALEPLHESVSIQGLINRMEEIAENSAPSDKYFIFGPVSLNSKIEELIDSNEIIGTELFSITERGKLSYNSLAQYMQL